jgi:F-type H+-transporting ATPase subunit b
MAALGVIAPLASSSGSFLVKPNVGLMVWTLLLFVLSMIALWKLAFPRITEALDRRQKAIEESIDTAERAREDAKQLLDEYRERLAEARKQAEEIVQRARQTAAVHERQASE